MRSGLLISDSGSVEEPEEGSDEAIVQEEIIETTTEKIVETTTESDLQTEKETPAIKIEEIKVSKIMLG